MKIKSNQSGFTIVELLVVIVVISILATLTIITYSGVQDRAYDSAVKNDLSIFSNKIEIQKITSTNGTYPTSLTSNMDFHFVKNAYGLDFQNYTLRYCINSSTNNYILYAKSNSGNYFRVTSISGVSSAAAAYGYSVCSQIGLSSTNPTTNGLTNSTWNSWTNN